MKAKSIWVQMNLINLMSMIVNNKMVWMKYLMMPHNNYRSTSNLSFYKIIQAVKYSMIIFSVIKIQRNHRILKI